MEIGGTTRKMREKSLMQTFKPLHLERINTTTRQGVELDRLKQDALNGGDSDDSTEHMTTILVLEEEARIINTI